MTTSLPEPPQMSAPTTELIPGSDVEPVTPSPAYGNFGSGSGGAYANIGPGGTPAYGNFGTPEAVSGGVSYSTSSGARPGSNLADMLQAAGMTPVAPSMDAGSGYEYTAPAQYSTAAPTPILKPLLGDPKVSGDERVYMGHDEQIGPMHAGQLGTDAELAGQGAGVSHKTTTVAQAANLPYLWYGQKENRLEKLQKDMRLAGYTLGASTNDVFGDTIQVWQGLVAQAAAIYDSSQGKTLVTPWDLLASRKKDNLAAGNVDQNGNVLSTSRSRSVNDLTEGQAWGTLRATMQNMLGRDPTDQEVRDFLSAANADAARDPSVSITTTHTNPESGESHSSTQTTGGYTSDDAARSAYDDLHDDAEYAKVQAGTTYFNAMLSALGEAAGSQ